MNLFSNRMTHNSLTKLFLLTLLTSAFYMPWLARADLQQSAIDAQYNKIVNPSNGHVATWNYAGKTYMRPVYPNQFKDDNGTTLIGPTVSEGTAYLMVFAALFDDEPTFKANYNYWRQFATENIGKEFREEDGQDLYKWLMPWLIAADGRVISHIPAADADLDIAYALLVADARWGGYREDFDSVLTAIREQLMMPNLKIIRPWPMKWAANEYGENSYYITSYNMPGYYRIFGRATNDESYWNGVVSATYDWIENHVDANTGLNSYAAFSDGSYCINRDFCNQFEVDAMRLPLRLAQAYKWDNSDNRAKALLGRVAQWASGNISSDDVPAAFYTWGQPAVSYSSAGMRSCLASAAAMDSSTSWWSDQIWNRFESEGVRGDVYQQMVTLMSMMTVGQRFIDPTRPNDTSVPTPLGDIVSISDQWRGNYLNVNSQTEWEAVVGQSYNADWGSMQWILEPVDGAESVFLLRNQWTGFYLNASSEDEWQPVLQAPYNPQWTSMQWRVQAVPEKPSVWRLQNVWTGQYLAAAGETNESWSTAQLGTGERLDWGSMQFRFDSR